MSARIAIVVNSASGNTAQLAEAMSAALGAQEVCGPLRLTPDTAADILNQVQEVDAVAVGFWCDKGACTPLVDEVLASLGGKQVFLFGTAGFGGSQEYFDAILGRVRERLPQTAQYRGGFMCQGKMGPGVRRRYEALLSENPEDARSRAMIENYDRAASHPSADDLDAAAHAIREAFVA